MKEMFEASVDGEAFDMDKWGQYFKPSGYNAPAGNTPAPAPAKAIPAPQASEDEEDDAPVVKTAPAAKSEPTEDGSNASGRAQDILAMIRNRNKQ
jgi:hypothetical protein